MLENCLENWIIHLFDKMIIKKMIDDFMIDKMNDWLRVYNDTNVPGVSLNIESQAKLR